MPPKQLKGQGRVTAAPPDKPKPSPRKSSKKRKAPKKADATPSTVWIRNIHNGAGGIRFDLTMTDRRIELTPRGRLGDLLQTTEEMREDPAYMRNVNLLFEEISQEKAADILAKQNINAQAYRGPSPMDFIRNAKGEEYAQKRAVITPSMESQGITVGQVSTAAEGRGSREVGNIERRSGAPPQQVEVPGSQPVTPADFDPNVMPGGLTVQQAGFYLETPPEQRWALLRRFTEEGAHATGLQVSVAPTERIEEE